MAGIERRTVLGVGFAIVTSALPSAAAAATGGTPVATAPDAPGKLNLSSSEAPDDEGFYTLTATWSAPDDDGGSPLTGYRHRLYIWGGSSWDQRGSGQPSASATSTAYGVATTGEYRLELEAGNAVGWSATATATATVPPDGVLIPAPPA